MSKQIPFVETDCKITFEDKTFSSGGAYLLERKDNGLLQGILYQHDNTIGDWKGSFKIPYIITNSWNSAFRDCQGFPQKNQSIRFTYKGKQFSGIHYNTEWSDVVHIKELSSNS